MNCKRVLMGSLLALALSVASVQACYVEGYVQCPNGSVVKGAVVTISQGGTVVGTDTTDSDGYYLILLPSPPGSGTACIDPATLPPGSTLQGNACVDFTLTWTLYHTEIDWGVTGPFCEQAVCWFTGGGALIDPDLGIPVADIRGKTSGKTPNIAFGGNVYPGCSPTAGGGGSWNHVDRDLGLHFHGTDMVVVTCGNVAGIPPGSTSPVTPFNYIEFQGVGWMAGLKGNKTPKQFVTFYARCEDHNEPGSKGANDGALIDRYYLQVKDGNGNVVIQVGSGNPGNITTVPITDGNFQLHISSCDNPPTP